MRRFEDADELLTASRRQNDAPAINARARRTPVSKTPVSETVCRSPESRARLDTPSLTEQQRAEAIHDRLLSEHEAAVREAEAMVAVAGQRMAHVVMHFSMTVIDATAYPAYPPEKNPAKESISCVPIEKIDVKEAGLRVGILDFVKDIVLRCSLSRFVRS